ncbi:bifunctional isocitrate dehydrogenase kinase/phosphatase [Uliginosibacterium gangwonense]|uniref:bifunctional isocitrate dehydrogenase kinase/phosphatase n=1 Tax=Uliginosibacterium gangwonense TaxID=392736 RepID=UPI000375957D|nr:bifunctional isocitrate dehydrogenase kinase/phosphatase [Uliginosibacterium gangwonense]
MNTSAPPAEREAHLIAQMLIDGFNNHYRIFRDTTRMTKARFEQCDWAGSLAAVSSRVRYYDERVNETVQRLNQELNAQHLSDATWQQVKLQFIAQLLNHKQPELAETFFNSVCCRILHRTYFHNDYIFARPIISTEFITAYPPCYLSYYPQQQGLRYMLREIILHFGWEVPFEDLGRDISNVLYTAKLHFGGWPEPEVNLQVQVLFSPFYRNKAAYIIGKAINGYQEYPFSIVIRHGQRGLYVDTVLLDAWRISLLFSLSHAYFMVDMETPSGYIHFLRSIMPNKPRSELYTMLGLGKQGKTMFYRDLISHLTHSQDQFIVAPGIRGMVMEVFTLPSFPYVFKIIKDQGAIRKEMRPETVKYKYLMVKQIDRVGRMADTLEFSKVALPRHRFHPDVLAALQAHCASSVSTEGNVVVINHLYIERRLTPLNIYLQEADDEQLNHVIEEYGNAIRDMANANIFPGDMLWKNFGMTRYGRLVFYDYDEIEYMTDCHFRHIPPAPYPEAELSSEPWYRIGPKDVFPEEFATFLLGQSRIRDVFMKQHADLLHPEFWQDIQQRIHQGIIEDFFPYPQSLRFVGPDGRSVRLTPHQ